LNGTALIPLVLEVHGDGIRSSRRGLLIIAGPRLKVKGHLLHHYFGLVSKYFRLIYINPVESKAPQNLSAIRRTLKSIAIGAARQVLAGSVDPTS